jgi:hypothetical protein
MSGNLKERTETGPRDIEKEKTLMYYLGKVYSNK